MEVHQVCHLVVQDDHDVGKIMMKMMMMLEENDYEDDDVGKTMKMIMMLEKKNNDEEM